jgi:hypothetical protein
MKFGRAILLLVAIATILLSDQVDAATRKKKTTHETTEKLEKVPDSVEADVKAFAESQKKVV